MPHSRVRDISSGLLICTQCSPDRDVAYFPQSKLLVRLMGANTDRETVQKVRRARFAGHQVQDLWLDIVKINDARTLVGGTVG